MNGKSVARAWSPLPEAARPRGSDFTIDFHGHQGSPDIERLLAAHPARVAELAAMAAASGEETMAFNRDDMLPKVLARMADIDLRLQDLDRMGIDLQVISPSPAQYCYWAEQSLATEIVAAANATIAATVAGAPSRLKGLGLVALQHPELAAAQLEAAIAQLGLHGAEISASIGGMELSDPRLEPFWQAAGRLRAIIFIHPLGSSLGSRLARNYLSNTIGQPAETTIALSHLIFSGVLDRHPDIRFLAAHGGGYLPFYFGRADHAYRVRPEARSCLEPPSAYLRRIFFDTVVFDPALVAHLVETAGIDRILMGTDYPFDMGAYDPHALLEAVPGLNAAGRTAILGGNAARLLNLKIHTDKEPAL